MPLQNHPCTADEISHSGNDAIGLLNDHEMTGARDIDNLHSLAQLIPQCVSVTRRGGDVIETLDHQERSVATRPPFVPLYASARRQVRDMDLRPALH
jgi:hypothetical protein